MPGYLVSKVKAHFMATQNEKGKTIPVNNVTQTIFLLKSDNWDLTKKLKVLWREKSALFARQKRKKKKETIRFTMTAQWYWTYWPLTAKQCGTGTESRL